MKKQNKTFAQRAKEIEAKYKRRDFDKIEQQDYESEMDNLVAEQEAYKAAHGMTEDPGEVMAEGGLLNPLTTFTSNFTGKVTTPKKLALDNTAALDQKASASRLSQFSADAGDTSLIPSYASAGANILSNLIQAKMNKKPTPLATPTYVPQKVDLTDTRNQIKQDAVVSGNIARRGIRDLSSNAGQALSTLGTTEAGIYKGLSDNLSNLGIQEQTMNVNAANDAMRLNSMNKGRTDMYNAERKDQWRREQGEYVAGAIGTIPGLMKDIQMTKQQDKVLSQLSEKDKNLLQLILANSRYGGVIDAEGILRALKYKGQ